MAAHMEFHRTDSMLGEELEVLESIYIHELTVEREDSGRPYSIRLDLHPSTGDDLEKQYVCMTLIISPTLQYPDESPQIEIKNPRGISEEEIQRVMMAMRQLAEERQGGPMLYELTEIAKECLTESNIPHTPCAICLEEFTEGDAFMKTDCYHYFHHFCLARYIHYVLNKQEEQDDTKPPGVGNEKQEEEGVVCPICRLSISYDLDLLEQTKEPVAKEQKYTVTKESQQHLSKMAEVFARQKANGGIIDLEAEKNKYLVPKDLLISVNTPAVSSADENGSEHKNTKRNYSDRRHERKYRHERPSSRNYDHRRNDRLHTRRTESDRPQSRNDDERHSRKYYDTKPRDNDYPQSRNGENSQSRTQHEPQTRSRYNESSQSRNNGYPKSRNNNPQSFRNISPHSRNENPQSRRSHDSHLQKNENPQSGSHDSHLQKNENPQSRRSHDSHLQKNENPQSRRSHDSHLQKNENPQSRKNDYSEPKRNDSPQSRKNDYSHQRQNDNSQSRSKDTICLTSDDNPQPRNDNAHVRNDNPQSRRTDYPKSRRDYSYSKRDDNPQLRTSDNHPHSGRRNNVSDQSSHNKTDIYENEGSEDFIEAGSQKDSEGLKTGSLTGDKVRSNSYEVSDVDINERSSATGASQHGAVNTHGKSRNCDRKKSDKLDSDGEKNGGKVTEDISSVDVHSNQCDKNLNMPDRTSLDRTESGQNKSRGIYKPRFTSRFTNRSKSEHGPDGGNPPRSTRDITADQQHNREQAYSADKYVSRTKDYHAQKYRGRREHLNSDSNHRDYQENRRDQGYHADRIPNRGRGRRYPTTSQAGHSRTPQSSTQPSNQLSLPNEVIENMKKGANKPGCRENPTKQSKGSEIVKSQSSRPPPGFKPQECKHDNTPQIKPPPGFENAS